MKLYDKMLARLYAGPVFVLAGTVAVEIIVSAAFKRLFVAQPDLLAHAQAISVTNRVAATLSLAFAMAWTVRNTWRLWAWHGGNGGEVCAACGGMAGWRRDGEGGRHRKCLACGNTWGA